jgi:hypothetical protein
MLGRSIQVTRKIDKLKNKDIPYPYEYSYEYHLIPQHIKIKISTPLYSAIFDDRAFCCPMIGYTTPPPLLLRIAKSYLPQKRRKTKRNVRITQIQSFNYRSAM